MKKFIVVGVLALVVIGCVLAAGCTSQSTPSTTGTDSVVGTWTLPNGTTVVFGNDFKGVMTQGENKINFTWKKTTDGKYQVDNEKGEQVIWTMDSSKNSMKNPAGMVLTKKASTASGAALPDSFIEKVIVPGLWGSEGDLSAASGAALPDSFIEKVIVPGLRESEGDLSAASGAMTDVTTAVPKVEITVSYLARGPDQRGFYPQSFTYKVDSGSTISFNTIDYPSYFEYYQNGELKKREILLEDYRMQTKCFYSYNPSNSKGPDFIMNTKLGIPKFGYKDSDNLPTPLAHENQKLIIDGTQKSFVLY